MKIVKSISLILLMTLAIVSCSKKDDNGSDSASLIGTWKLTAVKINGTSEALDACDKKMTVVFGSTTIKATMYYGENCEMIETSEGTYTRNGDILKTVIDGDTESVKISKLTTTTLEITDNEFEDEVYIETYTRQ